MYLLNGKKLSPGVAFSIGSGDDELQYPANWLELSTPEDRASIGIVDAPDPEWPDPRFFVTTQNDDGSLASAPVSVAAKVAVFESALDAHLDSVAVAHRYRDRVTFALRAGYAGPYQAEGVAFAQWMDACNQQAYTLLESVLSGTQYPPESIEAFLALLPAFELPA